MERRGGKERKGKERFEDVSGKKRWKEVKSEEEKQQVAGGRW